MSLWTSARGSAFIAPLAAQAFRVVEAQHILSARDLVDSITEHELLEELIEESKPSILKEKNYLLFTPFRYPPLKYGSRFGGCCEPSLWYGSFELKTAFAEVAYYRLKFFTDSAADLGYVNISMTAFSAFLDTLQGIDLTLFPFEQHRELISHQQSYEYSQALGADMRADGVELFVYYSARTDAGEKNIAAFKPAVFKSKKNKYIHDQQNWSCFANKSQIEFTRMDVLGRQQFAFSMESFLQIIHV